MRRADGSLSQRQRVPTASPVAYLGPLWGWGPGGSGVYLLFELDLIRRNYSVLLLMLARVKWAVGIFNSNFAISNH